MYSCGDLADPTEVQQCQWDSLAPVLLHPAARAIPTSLQLFPRLTRLGPRSILPPGKTARRQMVLGSYDFLVLTRPPLMTAAMLLALYSSTGCAKCVLTKKNESLLIVSLLLHLSSSEYSISFTYIELVMLFWHVIAPLLYFKQFPFPEVWRLSPSR